MDWEHGSYVSKYIGNIPDLGGLKEGLKFEGGDTMIKVIKTNFVRGEENCQIKLIVTVGSVSAPVSLSVFGAKSMIMLQGSKKIKGTVVGHIVADNLVEMIQNTSQEGEIESDLNDETSGHFKCTEDAHGDRVESEDFQKFEEVLEVEEESRKITMFRVCIVGGVENDEPAVWLLAKEVGEFSIKDLEKISLSEGVTAWVKLAGTGFEDEVEVEEVIDAWFEDDMRKIKEKTGMEPNLKLTDKLFTIAEVVTKCVEYGVFTLEDTVNLSRRIEADARELLQNVTKENKEAQHRETKDVIDEVESEGSQTQECVEEETLEVVASNGKKVENSNFQQIASTVIKDMNLEKQVKDFDEESKIELPDLALRKCRALLQNQVKKEKETKDFILRLMARNDMMERRIDLFSATSTKKTMQELKGPLLKIVEEGVRKALKDGHSRENDDRLRKVESRITMMEKKGGRGSSNMEAMIGSRPILPGPGFLNSRPVVLSSPYGVSRSMGGVPVMSMQQRPLLRPNLITQLVRKEGGQSISNKRANTTTRGNVMGLKGSRMSFTPPSSSKQDSV